MHIETFSESVFPTWLFPIGFQLIIPPRKWEPKPPRIAMKTRPMVKIRTLSIFNQSFVKWTVSSRMNQKLKQNIQNLVKLLIVLNYCNGKLGKSGGV